MGRKTNLESGDLEDNPASQTNVVGDDFRGRRNMV